MLSKAQETVLTDGQEALFNSAAEFTFDGLLNIMASQIFVFQENLT